MIAFLVCLVGLLLPTQLGLHFWPVWSHVYGLRIDYLSPTLYLTDLLLILILFLNLVAVGARFSRPKIYLLFLILINSILAISFPVTLIAWVRLILLYNLFVFIKNLNQSNLRLLFNSLFAGTVIVCCLIFLQTLTQGSINGFAFWLGERHFDITTPGIARLNLFGRQLLRPYASFPHPNSLAGYLLIIYFLIKSLKVKNIFSHTLAALLPVSIFLTFSKTAIFVFLMSLIFKGKTFLYLSLSIFFLALIFQFIPFTSPLRFVSDRLFLSQNAITILKNRPLFGVGLNNFIPAQGHFGLGLQGSFIFLQPVHNLFLLALTELGLLPCLFLVFLLIKKIKTLLPFTFNLSPIFYFLSVILITGSFDHYWLTLPQNRLLLAVIFGIFLNHGFHQKHSS